MSVTIEHDDLVDWEDAPAFHTETHGVLLDPERCEPLTVEACEQLVVTDCADRVGMLARHRWTRALSLRASREARITDQVRAIRTVPDAARRVQAWASSVDGVWEEWAAIYLLGLEGVAWAGLAAPESSWQSVQARAEAASLSGAPRDTLSNAVGAEVRSLAGELTAEAVAPLLQSSAPIDVAAGARAFTRLPMADQDGLADGLLAHLDSEHPDVFFEIARALALRGRADGLRTVTAKPELAAALGSRAIELFVMRGGCGDLATVGSLLRTRRVTDDDLDALARFGHPEAWAYIAHFLNDQDLASSAEQALRTLFGDRDDALPSTVATWEAVIGSLDLDAKTRLRRGRPWTAKTVAQECGNAELSAHDVARRVDELLARAPTEQLLTGPLALWALEPEASHRINDWTQRAIRIEKVEDTWATS